MAELGFYELIALIQKEYPQIFAILNKPGILDVALQIIQAEVDQRPWSGAQIDAALQATPYYQSTNQAGRTWDVLNALDPATSRQQQGTRANEILSWAHTNGLQMTADEAAFIAGVSLSNGETAPEWQANILNNRYSESLSNQMPVGDALKARASEYGVPLADLTLLDWQRQMMLGQVDMDTFDSYLREQAKSLYPGLANAIDRGITVAQYAAPYQQVAARELEINPADVDWSDPKWNVALHRIDPKTGDAVSMSLSDWTKELRTNSIYGFDQTQRAQEQATGLGQALLEKLGRAA